MDSAGNLVVVWLGDGEPRVGHRSIALLSDSAHTSPGREGRVIQETSAQLPNIGEFPKSDISSAPIRSSPSLCWNGGERSSSERGVNRALVDFFGAQAPRDELPH